MALQEILGWSDVFSTINFYPWWESVRSSSIVVISVVTAFYVYSSNEKLISCVPSVNGTTKAIFVSANLNCQFGDPEAEFTNNACKAFLPLGWFLNNFWWISVASAGVMFLSNNYWEYNTTLVTAIKELKNFYDRFDAIQFPEEEEMLDLVSKPGEMHDRRKEAREVWKGFLHHEQNSWGSRYHLRNAVSLAVAAVHVAAMLVLIAFLVQIESKFVCHIETTSFVCIATTKNIIFPVVVTILLMSIVQCCLFATLLHKLRYLDTIDLFLLIMNHSGAGRNASHKRFREVGIYVQGNKSNLRDKMRCVDLPTIDNYLEAIEQGDGEYFHIYKLAGGDLEQALDEIDEEFEETKYNSDPRVELYKRTMRIKMLRMAQALDIDITGDGYYLRRESHAEEKERNRFNSVSLSSHVSTQDITVVPSGGIQPVRTSSIEPSREIL